MKFNAQAALNQRIDRMTEKTLVLGTDISKERHAVQAMDFRGRTLGRFQWIPNDRPGFEQLRAYMESMKKTYGMTDVVVAMEPTGHYWFNLAHDLLTHGIEVVLVNPLTTKRNKENRDNCPSKNDPKDAEVIGDAASRGYYRDFRRMAASFEDLKTYMTNREFWVTASTRVMNRLTRWLDIRFPEFHQVFPDLASPRAQATLHAFPTPAELKGLTVEQVLKGWAKHMRRPGGARGRQKACELLEKARRSVGVPTSLAADKQDLTCLLAHYDHIQTTLKGIRSAVERLRKEIMDEHPALQQIQTLGLTGIEQAAVLGFGGNLLEFAHGNQLLRKAGLNLAEDDSGNRRGHMKLSKRGSAFLRKDLYLATVHLVQRNTAFRRWHEENVVVKRKTKMASIVKLMGKLARILVGLVHRDESFAEARAHPRKTA